MHTCIILTFVFAAIIAARQGREQRVIMSSQWVMKEGWLVKEQSPNVDMANGDNPRLDQLEANVREIAKHLQTLTGVVTDLVMSRTEKIAKNSKHRSAGIDSAKKRHFSSLKQPMSKMLEILKKQGLLKPLNPQQKPMTKYGNPAYYCEFHQAFGHETDRCARLKHEIQNLIDAGKIPDPEGYRF